MKKVNFHTHTSLCNHASGTMEEYVIHAIKQGYKVLGFSDHSPWKFEDHYVSPIRMKLYEFEKYKKEFIRLKEKYKEEIILKLGLEVEYFPSLMDWLKQFVVEEDLDYIIFGNHYHQIETRSTYYGSITKDDEMLKAYTLSCIEGMKTNLYSYLAHPDLFMRSHRPFDDLCYWASEEIAQASVKYNIPLEYNLEGLHYSKIANRQEYPYDSFWKIAGRYKCKAIIGVDAHCPEAFDRGYYEQAYQDLSSYGVEVIDDIEYRKWEQKYENR